MSTTIDGPTLIAQTLKKQGIEYIFGIVGVPVTPFAEAAIQQGITYIGFRNEQAAGYAASVVGYLTKRPAVLLTVAGPGKQLCTVILNTTPWHSIITDLN